MVASSFFFFKDQFMVQQRFKNSVNPVVYNGSKTWILSIPIPAFLPSKIHVFFWHKSMNGLILSAWNPHISKVQWSKTRIASTGLSAAKTLGGFEQQKIGCQHLKLVIYSGYIWMFWWILWWIYGKFKVLKWDGLDVFGRLGDLRWIYLKSNGWNKTKKHNQGDPLCRLMGYTMLYL